MDSKPAYEDEGKVFRENVEYLNRCASSELCSYTQRVQELHTCFEQSIDGTSTLYSLQNDRTNCVVTARSLIAFPATTVSTTITYKATNQPD